LVNNIGLESINIGLMYQHYTKIGIGLMYQHCTKIEIGLLYQHYTKIDMGLLYQHYTKIDIGFLYQHCIIGLMYHWAAVSILVGILACTLSQRHPGAPRGTQRAPGAQRHARGTDWLVEGLAVGQSYM
jgi:hypothetical protein